MPRRGGLAATAMLACVTLVPLQAEAEPVSRNAPGWAFGSQAAELVLFAGSGATLLSWFLPQRLNTGWKPHEARPFEPVWGSLSDVTGSVIGCTVQIANGYFFEAAYLAHRSVPNPYERALRVPLIDGEAALATTGVIIAMKRISGRCRPRAFKNGRCLQTRSAHEGFPSGHTGPVASIAAVHLTLALRTRDGQLAYRYTPFAIAEAAALGTAALRVFAGAHSWDDVALGWGVGHVVGALVALAHPMEDVGEGTAGATGTATGSSKAAETRVLSWIGTF